MRTDARSPIILPKETPNRARGKGFRGALGGLLVALLLAGACAPTPPGRAAPRQANLLTQEELRASGATNLYDAIARLRPRWLQVRGARTFDTRTWPIYVYLNRSQLGGVEALRQIDVRSAYAVRYLTGTEAQGDIPGLLAQPVEAVIVVYTSPEAMEP